MVNKQFFFSIYSWIKLRIESIFDHLPSFFLPLLLHLTILILHLVGSIPLNHYSGYHLLFFLYIQLYIPVRFDYHRWCTLDLFQEFHFLTNYLGNLDSVSLESLLLSTPPSLLIFLIIIWDLLFRFHYHYLIVPLLLFFLLFLWLFSPHLQEWCVVEISKSLAFIEFLSLLLRYRGCRKLIANVSQSILPNATFPL